MIIANPIYDIVFKYAMEDPEIAKDLLSLLLKINIVKIEMLPQEITSETRKGIRIFRLDFKATIKTETGEILTVLIEIQKSKKGLKLIRFRRYLSLTYRNEQEIVTDKGAKEKTCLPITTVYFLGYRLMNIRVPVAKIAREYRNALTDKPLKLTKKLDNNTKIKIKPKENFVEQLSHDMYVIQIPRLKKMVQTDIEKVLDVFSQTKYRTTDNHFLEYTGDISDPRVARLVKRLQRGTLDDDLLRAMEAEDEVESMFEEKDKEFEDMSKAREEERKAKEAAIIAKQVAMKDKEVAMKEKEVAMKEKEEIVKEYELLKQQLADLSKKFDLLNARTDETNNPSA